MNASLEAGQRGSLSWTGQARNGIAGQTAARTRIDSVDLVRGLVMVLMALDHVRDFFAPGGFNPRDVDRSRAVHDALDHAFLCTRLRLSRRCVGIPLR